MVEVAKKVADAIGAERVGIRLSPHSTFNDLPAHDEVLALYADLARALSGLLYLHVVGNAHPSFPETAVAIRSSFGDPIILNGNFEPASAESKLGRGEGELVAFGRPSLPTLIWCTTSRRARRSRLPIRRPSTPPRPRAIPTIVSLPES